MTDTTRTQKEEDLIKQIAYPDVWPDYPEQFTLQERTEFSNDSIELVLSSETCDIRISTHEEVISTTIRIDEELIDYQFEKEQNFFHWLKNMFTLPEFRFVFIQHNTIKGYTNHEYVEWSHKNGFSPVIEDLKLTDCIPLSLYENPQFSSLNILLVDSDETNYIYVYDKFAIEVSTRHEIHQRVFPIPSLEVLYNSIESGELHGYKALHINEGTIDKEKLVMLSI